MGFRNRFELTTEDTWMDRLRSDRKGGQKGFELKSVGRLHFGKQSFSGPSQAKTSRSKEDTSRTSRPRGYVRSITMPVVAPYEQGRCESSGRVP